MLRKDDKYKGVRLLIGILLGGAIMMISFASCSTTRVLADGEYRLAKNSVTVTNDKSYSTRDIEKYIEQKANKYFVFGWNPFLNLYNWANGKGKGWDKFVTKVGVAPVVFDETLVETSEDNILNHLEYLGYYNSKVTSGVTYKKRRAYVDYDVTLGDQIMIDSFSWNLPKGPMEEVFNLDTANITIKAGMPLSEAALEEETVRSSQFLRNNGFYGLSKNYYYFEADTITTPGRTDLEMLVREYTRNETPAEAQPLQQYHIGDVTISHPAGLKFRESVLQGLNMIKPGNLYRESDINHTYSRFAALQVFNAVNVEMTPQEGGLVDCNIQLSQSKLQGYKVNLEASTNSSGLFGVSPQISYFNKNIFHGGEWLNLSFMGNFQFKPKDHITSNEFGVSAGLSFPKFLGLPYRYFKGDIPRTDINFSYNYQNRPEYKRHLLSAQYGYTGQYKNRFSYQVYPLQVNIVRLSDLDPEFYDSLSADPFMRNAYRNHFDLGSGATLLYSTNMEVNPQTSYFYSRLQFDIAGNLLSAFKPLMRKDVSGAGMLWNTPYSQFVRFELTLGKTWRFGRNNGQAIATRLLGGAGFAYGNSIVLPFEKQFYGGGANSLRGWQSRSVGPGSAPMDDTFVIPNQTGDMKLEANAEYRFDMFWKLEGALFVDAGNVWSIRTKTNNPDDDGSFITADTFFDRIAANWGLGLRLDFNFLIVRVDWGLKVHDPSAETPWVNPRDWFSRNGSAVHFGVGYPF